MDDIREQILQTATRLFMKYGLRSVTIDDVCNELRISKKTFYLYFRQKEELIDNVIQSYCDSNKGKRTEKQAYWNDPSLNSIDKFIKATTSLTKKENQESAVLFYDLIKYYPEVRNRMSTRMDEDGTQSFKTWLQSGIDEGLVRTDSDINILAIYLNNLFGKSFPDLLNKFPDDDSAKILEFLIDCCIRIVVSEKGYRYYGEKYQGQLSLGKKSRKKKKE